tara:strand:+ start:301 stop:513 length:213 start_codon:yes stop_codon:yes gene_type:complete
MNMEVETAVVVLTAILVDLLVLAYAGKWLIAKWKEMKADGKITVDEVLDAAEEVVEMVKDTVEKLEGEEE